VSASVTVFQYINGVQGPINNQLIFTGTLPSPIIYNFQELITNQLQYWVTDLNGNAVAGFPSTWTNLMNTISWTIPYMARCPSLAFNLITTGATATLVTTPPSLYAGGFPTE